MQGNNSPVMSDGGAATEETIQHVFEEQQAYSRRLRQSDAAMRGRKLERVEKALLRHRTEIHAALAADFGKPDVEADLTEIGPVLSEIRHARCHLSAWMRVRTVGAPRVLLGTRSEVHVEPKGVVLVMAPWNYPLLLTLGPLVSAVAAGNCVVLKPSEHAPVTAQVVRAVLGEVFERREVAVVEGGVAVAEALLRRPFDHVYFTGSTRVGRRVMRAAAEHLTPVTLELGGKSPALVGPMADVAGAAEALVRGRFNNAGQTCIAPDYVLVHRSLERDLLRHLQRVVRSRYGTGCDQAVRAGYARLIHGAHFEYVRGLLEDAVAGGAWAVTGGCWSAEQRVIAPTVLTNVSLNSRVMEEEIFGPLLPVVPYDDLSEAIGIMQAAPPPLVQYLFGTGDAAVARVQAATRAGGTVVDDTLLHFMNPELPFGGVRQSGIGRGHGHAGFMTFSTQRAVLRRTVGHRILRLVAPPYGRLKAGVARRLLRFF